MCTLLVVEDDLLQQKNLDYFLRDNNYKTFLCSTAEEARSIIEEQEIDLAIIDFKLPGKNGLTLLEEVPAFEKAIKSILMTGYTEEENIIKAIKLGVDDFIRKPYHEEELLKSIERLLKEKQLEEENIALRSRLERENVNLRQELDKQKQESLDGIVIGDSDELKKVLKKAEKFAMHDVNIMVSGETGTGKEVIARYIHRVSDRREKPFVAVNCAELSPSIIESELFGHQKGSYTGAGELRIGLLEAANGGVLFLDEITEIPIEMQAKLLRVVETKSIRRVGSAKSIELDILIVSATNRDCQEAIHDSKLREDLYYRLTGTGLELRLPPLRERGDDVVLLLDYFYKRYQQQYLVNAPVPPDALKQYCIEYDWPGNVRQLSNFMRNWCLIGEGTETEEAIRWLDNQEINKPSNGEYSFEFTKGTFQEIEEAKLWLIGRILKKYGGNKTKTARHLGISYPGLLNILKKIDANEDIMMQ